MESRRIGPLVLAVVALTAATAVPVTARDGSRDITPIERPNERALAPATTLVEPSPRPRAAESPVSGDCDQPTLTDRKRDATGIDIVSVRVTSDCSLWTFTTRFAKRLGLRQIGGWAITFDTNRRSEGCDGGEYAVVAAPSASTTEALMVTTPSCDRDLWVIIGRVPLTQPDPRSLQVTLGASFLHEVTRVHWSVGASTKSGRSFDVAPDDDRVSLSPPTLTPTDVQWFLTRDDLEISWRHPARAGIALRRNGFAGPRTRRPDADSGVPPSRRRVLHRG